MKNILNSILNNKTSVFIIPFFTISFMNVFVLRAIYTTGVVGGVTIGTVTSILAVIWGILFILDQRRIFMDPEAKRTIGFSLKMMVILSAALALYFTYSIWGNGYLTLGPMEMIDNGMQHQDTLFHSAIAESYKRSFIASNLLNNESFARYHTFSHFLMGMISKFMDIPALIAYSFMFPTIFIPLYVLSQLTAVISAKNFFVGNTELSYIDIILIVFFNIGTPYAGRYGFGTFCFIGSESFLIANMLSFILYTAAFVVLKRYKDNPIITYVFALVIIPIGIFIISLSKISVGYIFTAIVMYYVFRKGFKNIKYWILDIIYFAAFIGEFWIFNGFLHSSSGTSSTSKYELLKYGEYCKGFLGIWGHVIVCSIMVIIFIIMEINTKKYSFADIKNGKTIWVEISIIMSLAAILPCLLLNLSSGNGAYFSQALWVPSICLLCGQDISYKFEKKNKYIYTTLLVYCIWGILAATPKVRPTHQFSLEHDSNLSQMLLEIRKEVGTNAGKYTIFLDSDSITKRVLKDDIKAMYVCPAVTGVGVINATYENNGQCYSFADRKVEGYCVSMTDSNHNMTLNEAVEKAGDMGKKFIVHITYSGYDIININSN